MPTHPNESEVTRCLNEVSDHWHNLRTLASLLERWGESQELLEAEIVRDTSSMVLTELEKMQAGLSRWAQLSRSRGRK